MSVRVTEVTAETVKRTHQALQAAYRRGGILCPLGGDPHPGRSEILQHLDDEGVRLLAIHHDDTLGLVALLDHGRIRACWGPVDRAMMARSQWALAHHLEAEGAPWFLDTGAPGWVARQYFERYAPQGDGGPWDTRRRQPGIPEGVTLADWDDHEWTLTIHRGSPRELWQWVYTPRVFACTA